jgi:hypothetical protein
MNRDDRIWRAARERDERAAPPFDAMWRAARRRSEAPERGSNPGPTRHRPPWALASVIVVCGVLGWCWIDDSIPDDTTALAMARTVSDWSAPSDEWLISTATTLPAEVPQLAIEALSVEDGAWDQAASGE